MNLGRNAEKNLDRALERMGKPAPEDMEAARERVRQSLRSQAADFAVDPIDVKPASLWRLRQPYLVAAAALLVFSVSLSSLRNAGIDARAYVESPDGSLSRVSGDKTKTVRFGERIEPGVLLRANDGRAVITLADSSRIELRPQTEFSVERADDGIRIHLRQGGLIVNAAKQLAGHLYVQTKDVTVSVVGTVFFVNAEAEGSRVAVIEGEVRVQQGTMTKNLLPGEHLTTNPMMEGVPGKEKLSGTRNPERVFTALGQAAAASTTISVPARQEFAAASIKLYLPRFFTPNDFLGFACRGTDGVTAAAYGNGADPILHVPQGRCMGDSVQLRFLLYYAFGLNQYQLRFGPAAAVQPMEGFQVQAAAENPSTVTVQQLRQMLRTMVQDRFKLVSHSESQELSGYALMVARNAPKLKEASGPQEGPRAFANDKGQIIIKGKTTLDRFAEFLSGDTLGGLGLAPVVNKTGLTPIYEYEFVRSGGSSGSRGASSPSLPAALPGMSAEEHVRYITEVLGPNWQVERRAATLSSVLEDALGLRLQPEKISVEVMVVDQVESPTPN
jgi:uncharacterized protein (TIGR03435 family)